MSADDHSGIVRQFLATLARSVAAKGAIHVGAHQGQEVDVYLEHGFERVLLIEANPEWCTWLQDKWRGDPRIRVLHYAVTDFDGTVELQLHTSRSGSNEPASVLPMKRFKDVVKTLETKGTLTVPAICLDTLFASEGLRPEDYDLLNIDIQGAEKLAFLGAPTLLSRIPAVLTEVNVIEMYEGGGTEAEIDALLTSHGLACVESLYHELYDEHGHFPAWGEKLYMRAGVPDLR
jgi:FkbM family methyltransferase